MLGACSDAAIEVRGLTKSYGTLPVLRGVDLRVNAGEIVALLGPNGAGKTTTVEILEGFLNRDGGSVRVLGQDPARAGRILRARVGIVLQTCGFDPFLTVVEALLQRVRWYPRSRDVEEVLDLVDLTEQRNQPIVRLSGGQQRRLDFALALAGDPELLFLDEPTTGFDPAARRSAWEVIRRLRAAGTSVLLTTHYLDEASARADRVAVLVGGQIIADGPPESLGDARSLKPLIGFTAPAETDLSDLPGWARPDESQRVTIESDDLTETLYRLTAWARSHQVELTDLRIDRPSLEDIYLDLIGANADA
jgi:ABC-2 type transport system ATP-binding protein